LATLRSVLLMEAVGAPLGHGSPPVDAARAVAVEAQAHVLKAVVAAAHDQGVAGFGGGRTGDELHDPLEGVGPVGGAVGAAHDLHPLEVVHPDGQVLPIHVTAQGIVHRPAVDQHLDAAAEGVSQAVVGHRG